MISSTNVERKVLKPCTTLENVNCHYDEVDIDFMAKDVFVVHFELIDKFKEIFQVKAVDIQTVIGNAGGYIGLFCGMN